MHTTRSWMDRYAKGRLWARILVVPVHRRTPGRGPSADQNIVLRPPLEYERPIPGAFDVRGRVRIRTAVAAFAELCLATRPRDR